MLVLVFTEDFRHNKVIKVCCAQLSSSPRQTGRTEDLLIGHEDAA